MAFKSLTADGRAPLQFLPHAFFLLALGIVFCSPTSSLGQSLMVGADGAIHLDEMQSTTANDPVVIQQEPELIQPPSIQNAPMGAMSMQSALSCPAQACDPCSVPFVPCAPCVALVQQPLPIKFSAFGEYLFLQPSGVDVVHAQQQNGIGGAGTVPFGDLGVTGFHYESGIRVGGDMALSCTTSIAGAYTWFESDARSRVVAPVIPGGGGAVGSLVQHPGAGLTASTGPVDARSEVNFQIGEGQYRSRLLQGPRYWVNGGLGGRYAHLDEEFGQVGVFGGALGGLITTQSDIDFNGGGVLFALDGGRTIGNRGFSVYGKSTLSPLVGRFTTDYSLHNDTTGTQLARVHWIDDRFTTILDYEVGLAWTGPRRRWRFAAGYTAKFWFNAVTTSTFIDAVQTNNYTNIGDTISFDGLVAHVEHLW
jgi:hypothetical protein